MEGHPVTDKDVGIIHSGYGPGNKFRDVRQKAEIELRERKIKSKKNKKDVEIVPKFSIGEKVVLTGRQEPRNYYLVEVLDFHVQHNRGSSDTIYYGIMQKTTDPEYVDRLNRLIHFTDHAGWFYDGFTYANVEDKNIKWLLVE